MLTVFHGADCDDAAASAWYHDAGDGDFGK